MRWLTSALVPISSPVRPEFTEQGELRIVSGRHPLLQETRQDALVPVSLLRHMQVAKTLLLALTKPIVPFCTVSHRMTSSSRPT